MPVVIAKNANSVTAMLEESRKAAQAGASHAAFLLVWETVEAALEEATGQVRLPASVLISYAFNRGVVDQAEYLFLLRLLRERSQIAQGTQVLTAEENHRLERLAERIVSPNRGREKNLSPKIIHEIVGGESYEYFPLSQYVVRAPGVCGGRPTFKYTRIEAEGLLQCLAAGETFDDIVKDYQGRVSAEALQEAIDIKARPLLNDIGALPNW